MKLIRAIDLCAGAGGWACAARDLPIHIELAVDHWPVACKTYELNHPCTRVECGDLREEKTQAMVLRAARGVDLILGGIPCEWLSKYRELVKVKAAGGADRHGAGHSRRDCCGMGKEPTMKVLSLWQPWATLIEIGAKRIETRSWFTSYRGPLAIHAAQSMAGFTAFHIKPIWDALSKAGCKRFEELPRGAILATCELVACEKVDPPRIIEVPEWIDLPPAEPERSFGDYTPGRYAWILQGVMALDRPIPFKGSQGLSSEIADEVIEAARRAG